MIIVEQREKKEKGSNFPLRKSNARGLQNPSFIVKQMKAWLRENAEKRAAETVSFRCDSIVSPMIFSTTWRCTGSDVLSVITTTKLLVEDEFASSPSHGNSPKHKKKTGGVDAWVLRADESTEKLLDSQASTSPTFKGKNIVYAPLKQPVYMSPLSNIQTMKESERAKRNEAFWAEEAKFMSKLRKRRKSRMELENQAATKIQSCVRGWIFRRGMRQIRKKFKARRRFQRGIALVRKSNKLQRNLGRNLSSQRERRAKYAIKIQKVWRGFLGARAADKLRGIFEDELLFNAATKIQSIVKRKLARFALYKEMNRANFDKKSKAARLIQRVYRGKLGRRRATIARIELRKCAATMIQRCFRQHSARRVRKFKKYLQMITSRTIAAIKIQAIFRGFKGRKLADELFNRELFDLENAAALSVQRVFRGFLGRRAVKWELERRRYERRARGILHIQRVIRGFLGRRVVTKRKKVIHNDIFQQIRKGARTRVAELLRGHFTDKTYNKDTVHPKTGDSLISVAVLANQPGIVVQLIEEGVSLETKNLEDKNAMDLCMEKGNDAIALLLILAGCEVTKIEHRYLHKAAAKGMVSSIKALLQKPDNQIKTDRVDDTQRTPLHWAAKANQVGSIQVLYDFDADLDFPAKGNITAIHEAAAAGSFEAVQLLISLEANISIEDENGLTPWRYALINNRGDVALLLQHALAKVKKGTSIDTSWILSADQKEAVLTYSRNGLFQEVQSMIKDDTPLDFTDKDGNSVLMCAVQGGNIELLQYCLKNVANINAANKEGNTAIHFANGNEEIANELVKRGASLSKPNKNGDTALHILAKYGNIPLEAIKHARDASFDVNLMNSGGCTALHVAAKAASRKGMRGLLQLGASVLSEDNQAQTPLHYACGNLLTTKEMIKDLISSLTYDRDQYIRRTDLSGRTALMVAASIGNYLALDEIGQIADQTLIDMQDLQGNTALHEAVKSGSVECVELLLSYNAQHLKNEKDLTPLGLSILGNHVKILKLLLSKTSNGADILENYGSDLDHYGVMHLAASLGYAEICTHLLHAANDLQDYIRDRRDAKKRSPIEIALKEGFPDVIRVLLASGAPIEDVKYINLVLDRHKDSSSKYNIPVQFDRTKASLKALSDYNINLQTPLDDKNNSPLHVAAVRNSKELIYILASLQVGIQIKNSLGSSPLHSAAEVGALASIEALIALGANIMALDNAGLTAINVAKKHHKFDAEELLETLLVMGGK